jgi:hypothetical protein
MKNNFTLTKMRFYLFAISFFGFINLSNAQVANWIGGVDSDYYNVKNWDYTSIDFTNLVSTNIIIGPGSPNNPTNIGYIGNETMPKRPATLTTNVGANIVVTGNFFPNGLSNLNGTITVDAPAAVFSVRNQAYLGKGDSGTLNVKTGKAAVKNNLFIGSGAGGNGLVTINTGTALEVLGSLEIGTGAGDPIGNLKIKDGAVNVESSINIGINGHVSISGTGRLIVAGNKLDILKAHVKSRTIGCTVGKILEVIFDGTKTTVRIKA